jgi:hypothetical protein
LEGVPKRMDTRPCRYPPCATQLSIIDPSEMLRISTSKISAPLKKLTNLDGHLQFGR